MNETEIYNEWEKQELLLYAKCDILKSTYVNGNFEAEKILWHLI